jgi:hypothetical protein
VNGVATLRGFTASAATGTIFDVFGKIFFEDWCVTFDPIGAMGQRQHMSWLLPPFATSSAGSFLKISL